MTFPVIHEGKILLRDGKPAMSLDCCCCEDLIPCCSDCWFPVGEPSEGASEAEQEFEVGGESYITDYIEEFFVENTAVTYKAEQNGPSQHGRHRVRIDWGDCPTKYKWVSTCVWFIPIVVTESFRSFEIGTEKLIEMLYQGNEWVVQEHETNQFFTGGAQGGAGVCSGDLEFSQRGTTSNPIGSPFGEVGNFSAEFTAVGGKGLVGDCMILDTSKYGNQTFNARVVSGEVKPYFASDYPTGYFD